MPPSETVAGITGSGRCIGSLIFSRRLPRVLSGLRALACSDCNPDKTQVRPLTLVLHQNRGFELTVFWVMRTAPQITLKFKFRGKAIRYYLRHHRVGAFDDTSDALRLSDKFLNQGVAWNGQSVVLGNGPFPGAGLKSDTSHWYCIRIVVLN